MPKKRKTSAISLINDKQNAKKKMVATPVKQVPQDASAPQAYGQCVTPHNNLQSGQTFNMQPTYQQAMPYYMNSSQGSSVLSQQNDSADVVQVILQR